MTRRIHPALDYAGSVIKVFGKVFASVFIGIAGLREPMPRLDAAGTNMCPIIFGKHVAGLEAGGLVEAGVEFECGQAGGGTLLVGLVEEFNRRNIGGIGQDPHVSRAQQYIGCNLNANNKDGHNSEAVSANEMRAMVVVLMRHKPMFEMMMKRHAKALCFRNIVQRWPS